MENKKKFTFLVCSKKVCIYSLLKIKMKELEKVFSGLFMSIFLSLSLNSKQTLRFNQLLSLYKKMKALKCPKKD